MPRSGLRQLAIAASTCVQTIGQTRSGSESRDFVCR
jgi:hypothetical protein